jgi:hypothetical protein
MKRMMMTMVVAASVVLGACDGGGGNGNGDGDGDGGDRVKRFVGVWVPTSGTMSAVCNGVSSSGPVTGALTWQAGSTSELLQATDDGCVIRADVHASTAVLDGAASCTDTFVDDSGGSVTTVRSISAYTFALRPDGLTATENLMGTVVSTYSTGQSITCTVTGSASYRKQ